MNQDRALFLGTGNMKKVILTTTIPSIIAMLINAIYNITDTFFIGLLKDTAALGAVAVAFPIFMVISAVGLGVGVGSASFISRSLGAGNHDIANKTVTVAFVTSLGLSILIALTGILFIEPILVSVGATKEILSTAKVYMTLIFIGAPFTILNMTLNNLIRAEGAAKYSMFAIMIGAGLNIALDPLLIFGFGLGISGAALATVLGQLCSTLFLLGYYYKHLGILSLSIKKYEFSPIIYKEIFKIGIPTFLTQFLSSFAIALLNNYASDYGTEAVAGIGIALRVNSLLLFILVGFKQGFQPIVGFNYGAKQYDRVREAIRLSLIVTTTFTIISTSLFYVFSKEIIQLFATDSDTIKMGANQLVGVGIMRPFLGVILIYQGLFQSLGKSIQAGVIAIGRQGVFLTIAILILPWLFIHYHEYLRFFIWLLPYRNEYGLYGIAYALPFSELITLLFTTIFAINIHKELTK